MLIKSIDKHRNLWLIVCNLHIIQSETGTDNKSEKEDTKHIKTIFESFCIKLNVTKQKNKKKRKKIMENEK